ncbi:hypothetical protein D9758_000912 [Tetrapyrgos nigripes]|uniref:FAD-binding FR-type domain-containing protein n=1 Tax=Tetrapyrgos nigripes TaxID=182062 RepID=A0A8H5GZH9_9AGAR|nr:hypothetical protein D9758_000912 [Tetrapyrgos nigripes]
MSAEDDASVNILKSDKTRQLHYQRHLNQLFGIGLYVIFFSFILIRALLVRSRFQSKISQLYLCVERRLKPQSYPRSHKSAYKVFGRFDITIPTFPQTLAIGSFTLLVLLCAAFGYTLRDESEGYQPTLDQYVRYIATRFGVLAFSMLPLLMLTAARMNVFVNLTRWDPDSWNIFHRWIGRLMLICAVVHLTLYTAYHLMLDQLWSKLIKFYFICGIIAACILSLMTVVSIKYFRRLSYEIFLFGHILGSITLILALFSHSMWKRAVEWLYLTLICWGVDRLFRVYMTSGFSPRPGRVLHFGTLMRIDVMVPENISVRPGHSLFGEPPFSIAAVTPAHTKRGSMDISASSLSEVEWAPFIDRSDGDIGEDGKKTTQTQTLTFLVRPFDGLTQKLSRHVLSAASAIATLERPIPLKVYFEGPYGNQHDLSRYDSLLFLAGGAGITFTLPYLLHWNDTYATKLSSSSSQRIHFVWVTRALHEIESIVSFLDRIDGELRDHVEIFYTGRITSVAYLLNNMLTHSHRYWVEQVKVGRPEIGSLLANALAVQPEGDVEDDGDLDSEPFSVAFLACGTGGMLDQCRQEVEVCRALTMHDITFIDEAFTR